MLDIRPLFEKAQALYERESGNACSALVYLALVQAQEPCEIQWGYTTDITTQEITGSMLGIAYEGRIHRLQGQGDWEELKREHCVRHGLDPDLYTLHTDNASNASILSTAKHWRHVLDELETVACQMKLDGQTRCTHATRELRRV